MSPYRHTMSPPPRKRLRTKWVRIMLSKRWACVAPIGLLCGGLAAIFLVINAVDWSLKKDCIDEVRVLGTPYASGLQCRKPSKLQVVVDGGHVIAHCECPVKP